MARLIDSSLWIDLTRTKSPQSRRDFVAPHVLDSQARVAEPILFEILRNATAAETKLLLGYFTSIPELITPADLWPRGAELGRVCRAAGINAAALDLLIAQVAIHHGAELVTFDADFQAIAGVSALKVILLQRPIP
jgi:hypothetical protein